MNGPTGFDGGGDPFSAFWSAFATKSPFDMMADQSAEVRDEMLGRMRQAFFDAWERHCIEFMGSEQFLEAMKQAMDGALTFRKQMNDFLTRSMRDAQIPTKQDSDSIVEILRGLEEGLTHRLEDISRRVAALETKVAQRTSSPRSRTKSKGAES